MSEEKRDYQADIAICEAATPGPWYPRATDGELWMNARYVGIDQGPGWEHDNKRGMGRDNEADKVIAITLLQAPPFADIRDEKWDENTKFIALARTALPWYIRRCMALEADKAWKDFQLKTDRAQLAEAQEQVGMLREALGDYDQIVRVVINFLRRDGGVRDEVADELEKCLGKACETLSQTVQAGTGKE